MGNIKLGGTPFAPDLTFSIAYNSGTAVVLSVCYPV